jgi:hypothetical protein
MYNVYGTVRYSTVNYKTFQKVGQTCTIYNMSGRVVSDIQTRAEGESLYIRYNTDANVVNDLKNDSSYEFIGEVILKINVVYKPRKSK